MTTDNIEEKAGFKKAHQLLVEQFLPSVRMERFTRDKVYQFFRLDRHPDAITTKYFFARVLHYMVQKGQLSFHEPYWFRFVDRTADEIKWWSSEVTEAHLRLPMQLEQYCYLATPCLILIAGLFNQGKSAFMCKTIQLNLDDYANRMHYFVSEGTQYLKDKFTTLGIIGQPVFKTYWRMKDFEDVVVANELNFIDYVRPNAARMWETGETLSKILSALGPRGIALVAIQKPKGRDMGFGGDLTAADPAIYISLDKGVITFIKIKKTRKVDGIQDIYKAKFQFTIANGVEFTDVHVIQGEEMT